MAVTIYEEFMQDRLYIKVDSEHDTSMVGAEIVSVNLIEGFRYATPFFVLKMIDHHGDSIHHTYFSPSTPYNVYLGEDVESAKKSSFLLGSLGNENINGGKPEEIGISAHFIMDNWKEWLSDVHSRSWNDSYISDVVEEIGTDMEFDVVDVEPTKFARNLIQPQWTNYQLMKWFSKHAINQANLGGYQVGVRLDNKLMFRTLDYLYQQEPVKEVVFGDGTLEDNFKNLDLKQNYSDMIGQGAGGLNYSYFNYDTKEWVFNKTNVSDLNISQLSDWHLIAKEHETADNLFYNGRDPNTKIVAENRINNVADSMLTLDITIAGDITLHMGDVVNIIVPASQFSKNILNTVYSGHWTIGKVNHQITSDQNRLFTTHLTLMRQGFNGTNFTEFAKTKKGRNINQ